MLEELAEHLRLGEQIEIHGFGRLVLDHPSLRSGPKRKRSSKIGGADRQVADVELAGGCRGKAGTAVVPAKTKPLKYTLDELLAQCDLDAASPRIPGWGDMIPVGKESL